jgi:ribonuclease P protein component
LGKDERLSRELILDKLFSEGRSVSQNGFTLVYLKTALPPSIPLRRHSAYPSAISKTPPSAIRIKRLLRETYRHHKTNLYQRLSDINSQVALMLMYKGKVAPDHTHVEKNVSES